MEKYLKTIRRTSAIGLWGAVGIVVLTAAFVLSPYRNHWQSERVTQGMVLTGTVLTVLAVGMVLLVVRKHVPLLRQSEGLETKVAGYARHIKSIYLAMLAVVAVVCGLMVLSSQRVLLMLAMVATLTLFLAYPNMYKMKVDLGLTDEEMKSLYGDKYIATGDGDAE